VDRAIEHDLWFGSADFSTADGRDTSVFRDLSGVDPPPYETRIAAGHFSYSIGGAYLISLHPIAPTFEILHPSLRQLLKCCFEDGHNSANAPSAQTWQSALNEAEKALYLFFQPAQHRGQHLMPARGVNGVKLGGRDPFPSLQVVKRGQHLQPLKPR